MGRTWVTVGLVVALLVGCGDDDAKAIDAAPDDAAGIDAQLSCDELGTRWYEIVEDLRDCAMVDDCRPVFDALNCDDPGRDGPGPSACPDVVNGSAYDASAAAGIAREYIDRGCNPGITLCGPLAGYDCGGGRCAATYACCPEELCYPDAGAVR